ncbi:hypothetical protein PtrCC142_009640 [Pyrenophora tritici-repentis]|nr:hypothetical protein PtrEW4_005289 [Pyrenophora tritici-repentis]KAI1581984.1 hypothetical protein PtrEW13061_009408 [Pyrenophora tritici-repentis]KAI1596433.1 hypothetical protein PtrCC142_009640 [Pyrenophora tritici-repentis]
MLPPTQFYPSSDFVHNYWQVPYNILWLLWHLWLQLPDLHIIALLCLPPLLFWVFISPLQCGFPQAYASCDWRYWSDSSEARNVSSSCPIDKHLFETPTQPVCLMAYAILSLVLVFSLIACRSCPRSLLKVSFWLQFLVTVAIRCLSSFSGLTTQLGWSALIWNSNSIGKFVWLWIMVEAPFWNWTYLGFYEDYYFQEGTRTVYDQVGRPVWIFISEKTGKKNEDTSYHPYGSIFRLWRDIAVRLSYYHVIDNTIHVLWFRYFNTEAPYTTYLNNSELLTMVLLTTLVTYTYARMHTHVHFDHDDEESGLLVDIKSSIPSPIHLALRDLFSSVPWQHDFRAPSAVRYGCMVVFGVLATGATATWHIPDFPMYWSVLAEFMFVGWLRSFRHVEAGMKRVREEKHRRKAGGICEEKGQQRATPPDESW